MEKTKKEIKTKIAKKLQTPTSKVVERLPKKAVAEKSDKLNTNKLMRGIIVSTKMQKTVVVAIERKVAHKLYGKLIKVTKRLKVDVNGMDVKEGDKVVIEMTKPISKDKNFRVIKKVEVK